MQPDIATVQRVSKSCTTHQLCLLVQCINSSSTNHIHFAEFIRFERNHLPQQKARKPKYQRKPLTGSRRGLTTGCWTKRAAGPLNQECSMVLKECGVYPENLLGVWNDRNITPCRAQGSARSCLPLTCNLCYLTSTFLFCGNTCTVS